MTPSREDRIRGCLLGSALGDALGYPVEFLHLSEIRSQGGISWSEARHVSDDTQMMLFTAEGLVAATGSDLPMRELVHRSYLRWLDTQGGPKAYRGVVHGSSLDGALVEDERMRVDRAPGRTCMDALKRAALPPTVEQPLNDSKGCGGVMRAAPCAMIPGYEPFETGVATAALTHGHPTGYLAAGAYSLLVSELLRGESMGRALRHTLRVLRGHDGSQELLDELRLALSLAAAPPRPETMELLGDGWVAEEALAMAVWCVLAQPDLALCMDLAVMHSGDSDSVGILVGGLLGAVHGTGWLPRTWLERIDVIDLVERVADDIIAVQ